MIIVLLVVMSLLLLDLANHKTGPKKITIYNSINSGWVGEASEPVPLAKLENRHIDKAGSETQAASQPTPDVERLVRDVFFDQQDKALAVFQCESGLNPKRHSEVDVMSDGRPFSIGLAQINLTVSEVAGVNCSKAFHGRNKYAKVVDESLYNKCVELAEDPNHNLASARGKFDGRKNWTAWLWCDNKTKV